MVLLFSSLVRGLLGVVGATLGLLLALALLGSFSVISSWSPTRLSGSMADFMQESRGDHWQAIAVTLVISIAACAIAVILFDRREPIGGSSARP
jgi:ABC-type transport system involved in multi-copper enzyme maturation permease subunit